MMDATLFHETDMEAAATATVAGRSVAVFSRRSPDKPTANEDSAAILPWDEKSGAVVVADGLGGASYGERASRAAIEALRSTLAAADPATTQLRTAILDGIEAANRAVLAVGSGAATTLAVVELTRNVEGRPKRVSHTARTYHVGDSAVLVFGQRGRLKRQTVAHSPVGYGVESGLLDEGDAMHHEDRHLVSNVVGCEQSHIEIGPLLRLASLDTVLVASDGLFDNLTVEEIVHLSRTGPLPKAAERLSGAAHTRMTTTTAGVPSKPDDLTFILVR